MTAFIAGFIIGSVVTIGLINALKTGAQGENNDDH